jgi:hypothetical protein
VLVEFDVFVHKVRKGFLICLRLERRKMCKQRLVLNDMSKSVYRGYAIDAEKEELEYMSRNLGGM